MTQEDYGVTWGSGDGFYSSENIARRKRDRVYFVTVGRSHQTRYTEFKSRKKAIAFAKEWMDRGEATRVFAPSGAVTWDYMYQE